MIVHLRAAGPLGRLSGAALMAAAVLSVGACTDFSLGSAERASGEIAGVETAPPTPQGAAAPQERMPPPFRPADAGPPPTPRVKPASLLLTVAEGDSVHRIARQYGVTPHAIISLNGLSEPYWLLVGQRLRIPLETDTVARRAETSMVRVQRASSYDRRVTVVELVPSARPEASAGGGPAAAARPSATARDERPRVAAVAATGDEVDARLIEPAPTVRFVTNEESAPMPPESPGTRTVRAESSPSTLSAMARQADVNGVPLPPQRNTFLWPIEGRVISGFGSKPGGMHNDGINIAVPVGTAVRAAQNGVVAYAGNELRGYGNLVLIRHDGGWMTAYAHNDSLLVGKGDVVERGQVISRSGKSGRVSRPQAHFEIRRDGEPQDPLRLLTRK